MLLLKLDLQYFAGEKTEKATPKKREDEREKGKVAKSQDINTALLLFGSFMVLLNFGTYMKNGMITLYKQAFTEYINWDVTIETVQEVFVESIVQMVKILSPIMVVALIIGVASNLAQFGFLMTTDPLKPDLKKLDPIKGAKRIFSARALVELLKSMFKIVFIGSITFFIIWLYKDDMMQLAFKSINESVSFFSQMTITMGIASALTLLFLSILDYVYQRYDFEKNMKMSKDDIKDEHKNMEGDPQIKSKVKQKQQEMANNRMMSEIPEADVVITNPTHYAIAIKYDESQANAPYIVGKGSDHLALKMREIARTHDVVTIENQTLARSLYDVVEIGDVIPEQFYKAIAEVLAYVYRIQKRL